MIKEEQKEVRVKFSNACGKMELKVKGKNALEQSLKIMQVFDDTCDEKKKESE
jgi:hypothetical protein